MRKTVTDRNLTDRHQHTIIRRVWWWAYKNVTSLTCVSLDTTAQIQMVYFIACTFSKSYYQLILISNFEKKYYMTCPVVLNFLCSVYIDFEGILRLQKQVFWRWHHQDAGVSGRQHFRGFCGKGFPADSQYSNGNQLCPSSSWHISQLIWSRIHSRCFQPKGNSLHLRLISKTGTLMFCP